MQPSSSKLLRKHVCGHLPTRTVRRLSNLVTPEIISKFERSESAQMAVNYIDELSGAHSLQINQSIYTLIRDYVLLELTIANAHRSGRKVAWKATYVRLFSENQL